jgi:putative GTP pyrophosphokinase
VATRSQIDRLGEQLRRGPIHEEHLRALDEYRRSYTRAYGIVIDVLREQLKVQATGRPAQSTAAITEKLKRESIRLTQMQDVSGCRLVVPDLRKQDVIVREIVDLFPRASIVDRRKRPSHGYRAVHIVVEIEDKAVEVQVRSVLQHLWAELSEKFADLVDAAVKYGGGPAELRQFLDRLSKLVADSEDHHREMDVRLERARSDPNASDVGEVEEMRIEADRIKTEVAELLVDLLKNPSAGGWNVVPD